MQRLFRHNDILQNRQYRPGRSGERNPSFARPHHTHIYLPLSRLPTWLRRQRYIFQRSISRTSFHVETRSLGQQIRTILVFSLFFPLLPLLVIEVRRSSLFNDGVSWMLRGNDPLQPGLVLFPDPVESLLNSPLNFSTGQSVNVLEGDSNIGWTSLRTSELEVLHFLPFTFTQGAFTALAYFSSVRLHLLSVNGHRVQPLVCHYLIRQLVPFTHFGVGACS